MTVFEECQRYIVQVVVEGSEWPLTFAARVSPITARLISGPIQTDTDGTPADQLLLELKGKTSSNVVKRNRTQISVSNWISIPMAIVNRKIHESKDILEDDLLLGRFGGRAEFGNHMFRFSFMLPHGLPSSMKVTRRPDILCVQLANLDPAGP